MTMSHAEELAFARTSAFNADREHREAQEALRVAKIATLSLIYASGEYTAASNERARQQVVDEALLTNIRYGSALEDEQQRREAVEGARLQLALAEDAWREHAYGVLDRFSGETPGRITEIAVSQAIAQAADRIAQAILDAADPIEATRRRNTGR